MKEEAEEWKGLMDVSLVFIAIFLAVLTAFLVPAAQALSPPSNGTASNSTSPPPPLPPKSDQNVCAFYYLSLIMAMCNAVLCVLGRQWVGKLLSRPSGKTHRERTMRHEARKKLAYDWIKPLVAILYWSLLLSIGLFIAGLLYQLRNLSTTFDQSAPILETTWGLGILLAASIVAGISATTIHAIQFDSSPFEGIFSKFVVEILQQVEERWEGIEGWRINVKTTGQALFTTYMELIAEANDPKLLDRVASSFSYWAWMEYGQGSTGVLVRAYDRLMASDTSNRVRETVRAQISRFAKFCRERPWKVENELRKKDLNQFLRYRYSFPSDFPAWATILSFQENNINLYELGSLPLEECVAQLLCTYDQNMRLGDRTDIWWSAVRHCVSLVRRGNEDDVMQILSHVDPRSVVRSFMRAPGLNLCASNDFVHFLVRDCRAETLLHINEFLTDPPSNVNHVSVPFILLALLSPESPLPLDIDFTPIIAFVSHSPTYDSWTAITHWLTFYLHECDISAMADNRVLLVFLRQCIELEIPDPFGVITRASEETKARARSILEAHFTPHLIPLPPSRPSSPWLAEEIESSSMEQLANIPTSSGPETAFTNNPLRRPSSSSVHIEMTSLADSA
ncbi:hypothetical protein SISNIDRAFT_483819 [Sistotremastrum niveocremeum HHB9708]|uniref:DUF6535 domain-containing protein n=1 Tax=Sistotremastrum niveocremeum HHB9708 TaxID=1314777 RepID=A0A164X3B7_9AGAM|nr:hypothetical protein SISNIDRAFT_483819 [Sistotremastrum niveocremeum HHB9708]